MNIICQILRHVCRVNCATPGRCSFAPAFPRMATKKRRPILARILLKVGLNLQRQDMLKREAARKDVSLLSSVRPRRLPNRVQIEDAIPFFKSHEDFWGGSLAQRSTENTQGYGGCENQEGR